MERRIWPLELPSNSVFTNIEKDLYLKIKRIKTNAWFLFDIDPIGLSNESVRMGMLIHPDKGIITFSMHQGMKSGVFAQVVDTYTNMVENNIYNLLLESSVLIATSNGKKMLKYPYKHINVLEEIEELEHNKCCAPVSFSSGTGIENLFEVKGAFTKPYAFDNFKISEVEAVAIVNKLAPEYTVTKPQKVDYLVTEVGGENINIEMLPAITGKELEYSTFLLDEDQVKYINEMGIGHRVLLANAGAGKSVLVLSRAYRYASTHKKERVLITCYNNNLADAYKFKNSCANFGHNNNLYIMTFHKLIKKIYQECLNKKIMGEYPSEQEIQDLLMYIERGNVKLEFSAIFVDEVQIFTPLYLDICYALLAHNEDALFLLAGDLNQTVRSQSRKGDAPWKKIHNGRLNFQGRVKYMSQNYRNSEQISRYLNGMLLYMNSKLSENNLINIDEFEYNIFGTGPSQNIALEIKRGIPRIDICKKTVDAIEEIARKYKISYSDIAVLFPYKENRVLKYYLLYWLTQELRKRGIEYSLIFSGGQDDGRRQYSNTNGVVLSTIDSSLGLDFKAVVLTGLYPYEYIYSDDGRATKIKTWNQLSKLSSVEQENMKVQLRKIYTACSRAREVLYVLSDIERGNPFEDVLGDRSK